MRRAPGCAARSRAAADGVDCATRDLERRPPRGLQGNRAARACNRWLETAYGGIGAAAGDPNDESREVVEPRVEHDDPCQLEDAAERRQREHAVGVAEPRTDPVCR